MFLSASNSFVDNDIEMTDMECASSAFSYFSFNTDMRFDDGDVEMEDRSTGSSPPPPLLPPPAPVVPDEPKLVYDDFDFEVNVTGNGVYLNVTFKNTGDQLFHVSIHHWGIEDRLNEGRALNRDIFHLKYRGTNYPIKLNNNHLVGQFNKKITFPVQLLNEYLRRNSRNNDFTQCIYELCKDPIYSNYWC
jgi:hypothetical protein